MSNTKVIQNGAAATNGKRKHTEQQICDNDYKVSQNMEKYVFFLNNL